jgi:serine protease AprX
MYWVNRQTGAADMWSEGFTGSGIDIALIDTGIAPVDGLRHRGKVINGPDLSFDSQVKGLEYLDAYGHGTHLAGIIAGRVDNVATLSKYDDGNFVGVAPDARIVNVKVADAVGSTDVSQVIAAIDWVIDHRRDNGMNIRGWVRVGPELHGQGRVGRVLRGRAPRGVEPAGWQGPGGNEMRCNRLVSVGLSWE